MSPSPRSSSAHVGASLYAQPWKWTDEGARDVMLSAYRGTPVLLTAVYTSCTVRCPFTIEKLRRVDASFRARNLPVQVVLVTLDPHVDTPERLRRFKASHKLGDNWHLLQGSDEDTRALARYLDVRAIFDDGHIDHDVQIGLFDSEGRSVRHYDDWSFDEDAAVTVR